MSWYVLIGRKQRADVVSARWSEGIQADMRRCRRQVVGAAIAVLSMCGGLGAASGQTVFAPPPEMQGMRGTAPMVPPMAESNESNKEQLELVRGQGKAEGAAMEWVLAHATGETGVMRAGPYRIGWTLTAPEGSYRFAGGMLRWQEAGADRTAHLRVFVMDAGDGRLVPELRVRAALLDDAGRSETDTALPFAWYPLLNGYGENVRLAEAGRYRVRLEIEAPTFWRHDPYNGYRYVKPTVALSEFVRVDPVALRAARPATEQEEQNLQVARGEAEALRRTLGNMYRTAIQGKDRQVGDYIVANANEYSEAYWYPDAKGHFVLATEMENSAARNSHVEVAVMDAETGRFVPGLHVTATLTDAKGRVIGTREEPFMWHPWLWHYGENWRIAHGGEYTVHVHFDPPSYARYGKTAGNIMAEPVDADFAGEKLIPGQK